MNTPVDKKGFIQICIVVKDIEKAAKKWADLLGIEVPQITDNDQKGGDNYIYRGSKTTDCKLKVANIFMDNFVIELHQPTGGDSSFEEFIQKHGNGVHHIGFEVGDKRDAVVSELEESGYDIRTVGIYPGSSWTIIDSEDDLGVNLNIKPVR